jgi:hypothetical protein
MTIRTILIVISFGLMVWLLVDGILQLDIAATKNDGLTNSEKLKVDRLQNMDSVKLYAKAKLDTIRQNTRVTSSLASKRIWLILGLIACQIALQSLHSENRNNQKGHDKRTKATI